MSDAPEQPAADDLDPPQAPVTGSAPQQAEEEDASVTPDDVIDATDVVRPPQP